MKILSLICCLFVMLLAGCDRQTPEQAAVTPATSTTAPTAKPADKIPELAQASPDTTSCTLKLGYEAWEPYQYTGMDNKATGLDIELIEAISKKINCQIVAQQGTWIELVAALRNGDIDLLPGASMTAARQEFAYFSEPYRTEQFVLFIRSKDAASYPQNSIAEFVAAGKRVGIISEYYYGPELADLLNQEQFKSQFVESSLVELNLARLIDEDIDGMLEDSFVAHSMLKRKGLDSQIGPHSISLGNSDVYLMFSKASVKAERVDAFNQALAQSKLDGSYNEIVQRYQQ